MFCACYFFIAASLAGELIDCFAFYYKNMNDSSRTAFTNHAFLTISGALRCAGLGCSSSGSQCMPEPTAKNAPKAMPKWWKEAGSERKEVRRTEIEKNVARTKTQHLHGRAAEQLAASQSQPECKREKRRGKL